MDERPWLDPPPELEAAYSGFQWALAYQYPKHSVVYRISRGKATELFVKLSPVGHYPTLSAEAERMRWAGPHLPVPDVVDEGSDGLISWLVTCPLPGRDGTHPDLVRHPADLTRILARGLRRFHDAAPAEKCPFDFRLDTALAHVQARLNAGHINRTRDFHEEFAHLTPSMAVALLHSTRPDSEDLVVCHGDYCLPNIFVEGGQATGYLDLGELGVADRWWDLAVATWSLTWNLGPGFEELFLTEYGVARDPDRTQFYRLLYDLAG